MALDINEFISLKPIIDQLHNNPNSKIKISKSQSSVLANMSEEKFNSFLELMKKPLSEPNPPTSASTVVKNIESIKTTRDQKLTARVNNPEFIRAAKLKVEKEKISNFLNSQKNAVDFLKQDQKPFNFLTKPYFKPGDPALRQEIQGDLLFRKQLEIQKQNMSIPKPGLPSIFARGKRFEQDIINTGAQKRMAAYERAQQARLSTQSGQNTPVQQASSVTPPPRSSSRASQMLGEDTVRAASVIHSSKMNYATVGLAGMAAVFGIASASRQRSNLEQETQSRF